MVQNHTIKYMNYVIGVFDGKGFSMSHITDYTAENAPLMKYHRSWDWIMRVIARINKLIFSQPNMEIRQKMLARWGGIQGELLKFNIQNTHYNVFIFIEWYNSQKQEQLTNQ